MSGDWLANQWLIVTVVNKGIARKVVQAARHAGAMGGTVIPGRGTGTREMMRFLGLPYEVEKEVILTLLGDREMEPVQQAIQDIVQLNRPGTGIAFVIHVSKALGLLTKTTDRPVEVRETVHDQQTYELIVTIVNQGEAGAVVEASRKAGAGGGTILTGRGTSHEQMKLFGIPIEPEKEIVLTLVTREQSQPVMEAILAAARLHEPGKGISFVLPVERVFGINHHLQQEIRSKFSK